MDDAQSTQRIQVRTMQIIWFALLMGVTVFAGVAMLTVAQQPAKEPFISYVAVVFSVGALVMSVVVPIAMKGSLIAGIVGNLGRDASKETITQSLAAAYQTLMIISLAILEGAAFFAITAYQLEGAWWTLAAAGVLWLLILVRFPTASRLEDWCRSEYETFTMNQPQ